MSEVLASSYNVQAPTNYTLTVEPTVSAEDIAERVNEAMNEIRAVEQAAKPKRVVRRKEKPQFWLEETKSDISEIPTIAETNGRTLVDDRIESPNWTSPFVNLIPLTYVCHHANNFDDNNVSYFVRLNIPNVISDKATKMLTEPNGLKPFLMNRLSVNYSDIERPAFMIGVKYEINKFMQNSELLSIGVRTQRLGNFIATRRYFLESSGMVSGRTFDVNLGQLSAFLRTHTDPYKYVPQLLAVVLPENYLYQKEYVITHGKVDLSKVILLVNRDLDNTDFHHKAFRAYYRKYILPLINELNVQVWKVPQEFIMDNCFHSKINLESKSFVGKMNELKEIYQKFRDQYEGEVSSSESTFSGRISTTGLSGTIGSSGTAITTVSGSSFTVSGSSTLTTASVHSTEGTYTISTASQDLHADAENDDDEDFEGSYSDEELDYEF